MAKPKKEPYYRCVHCKTEIYWNTHKEFTPCACGKLAIDGCEDYVRIIGNKQDFEVVYR